MTQNNWFMANLTEISEKLRWLKKKEEGTVYSRKSSLHHISIQKVGTEIQLYFIDPNPNELVPHASGIMSRVDLEDPLHLIAAYTQAMLLPLIWRNEPKLVYTVGFGGGRVPMILHHYLPEVVIESTDIESDLLTIAPRFFGVRIDQRQKLIIQDGEKYLANRPKSTLYDFILLDAFRGTGYGPYHLNTTDFYNLCKNLLY